MLNTDLSRQDRLLDWVTDRLVRSSRRTKGVVLAGCDAMTVLLCTVFVMTTRLGRLTFMTEPLFWGVALLAGAVFVSVLAGLKVYRMMVRFTSLESVGPCSLAAASAGFTLLLGGAITGVLMPRLVPLTVGLLLLVQTTGYRIVARLVMARLRGQGRASVIVYGAGAAGRQLFHALRQSPQYRPVAFVDDSAEYVASSIGGCMVHPPSAIGAVIERYQATRVLLAIPSASAGQRKAILHALSAFPVHVQTMPGTTELIAGRSDISDVREVRIEELLGRDTVPGKIELMATNIRDRVVMVTGAGGSIGSELCRQIVQLDPVAIVLFEISEVALYTIEVELRGMISAERRPVELFAILGSVRDEQLLERVLSAFEVDTIYHAAAYKHVPIVEENVIEGLRNNVFGTATLARAAVAAGVEVFVMISTDKAVRPTNVMGASKRLAELVCQDADRASPGTRFTMVRFGNVLGSSGSVVPRFAEQIRAGGPVTVTHPEVTRYFMTIPEAAQLVIQAGAMGKGGDVFLLDMGEPVRIVDLAVRMIRLSGLRPYLLDCDEAVAGLPDEGDIGITFCGLRNGEKLYEELLIGDNPEETEHPLIMKANEIAMAPQLLAALLDELSLAADCHDITALSAALEKAPLGYSPNHRSADIAWKRLGSPEIPRLVVVR